MSGRAPNKNVAWVKPQEPSFLKAFKAKVGYKEPDTIEAKRAKVEPSGEGGGGGGGEGVGSDGERDDELPTVVVLRKGDVGEEEYQKFRETIKEKKKNEPADGEGEEEKISVPTVANRPPPDTQPDSTSEEDSGKIVFKRPVKRRRSSSEGILDASTKKTKEEGRGGKPRSRRRSSSSGVKNSSLLSFGDEEEV